MLHSASNSSLNLNADPSLIPLSYQQLTSSMKTNAKACQALTLEQLQASLSIHQMDPIRLLKKLQTRGSGPSTNQPFLIGVAGFSGSGKTTWCDLLSHYIQRSTTSSALRICMDQYYHDLSDSIEEAGSYAAFLNQTGYNFDRPEAVNLEQLAQDLNRLANGQPVHLPWYDYETCASNQSEFDQSPMDYIIVDGLFVLQDRFLDLFDLMIYVDTPESDIQKRWYERALKEPRYQQDPEATRFVYETALTAANTYILPSRNNADIIIDGTVSTESWTDAFRSLVMSTQLYAEAKPTRL